MGSTSQWKPSQAGLLISTTVVIRLQDILLSSEGYNFFLTSRLLQECLENLFSRVRLKKPVPDAYDMKCTLKLCNEVRSSGEMELEGLKRAQVSLEDSDVFVTEIVTDRHPQVRRCAPSALHYNENADRSQSVTKSESISSMATCTTVEIRPEFIFIQKSDR
ncbi:hypothetical protein HPB52_004402 [Rhipicephalus sanguineus]|uniref:Uncharacterized protein n=1 Tax=Rhipicephalus sanguineus TaxID=34632 RepID=A0A9D4Q5E7_RHISA|nr:hypothetical protein HPB52_004402 [Rhipicephalus sanguineus]